MELADVEKVQELAKRKLCSCKIIHDQDGVTLYITRRKSPLSELDAKGIGNQLDKMGLSNTRKFLTDGWTVMVFG